MELFSGWSGPCSRKERQYYLGVRNIEAFQFNAVPYFPDSQWTESVILNTIWGNIFYAMTDLVTSQSKILITKDMTS
jgi:hypothetical protein